MYNVLVWSEGINVNKYERTRFSHTKKSESKKIVQQRKCKYQEAGKFLNAKLQTFLEQTWWTSK